MSRERLKLELLYHDIKGPLAIVETGISSLLNKPSQFGPLTAQQEKVLQRILRNIKIAQNLVDDTLELRRSEPAAVTVKSVVLSELITAIIVEIFDLIHVAVAGKIKAVKTLAELKQILERENFFLTIGAALWAQKISIDEKKVKQILRNLLINAIKFRNTKVALEVDESDYDLLFSVIDDGRGIPPVYHDKIFEGYFQMDDQDENGIRGHGLGLAGVLILVEDMGGSIVLESDVEKGAKFTVRLPITE